MTQALDRVREAARRRKKEQSTPRLDHIDADTLRTAFYGLKGKAAPGVGWDDGHDYEADLEPRIEDLAGRVHRGAYRPPNRRAGRRYRRPMGGSGRSRSPPWRTRSCRAQPSWRSTRSMKATLAASRTGSDPGEGHTMRWKWRYRDGQDRAEKKIRLHRPRARNRQGFGRSGGEGMAVSDFEAVRWLPSGSTSAESRSGRIGPIILEAKQTESAVREIRMLRSTRRGL